MIYSNNNKMVVEGTLEELQEFKSIISGSKCNSFKERSRKIKYENIVKQAIQDEEFEREKNYIFTTKERF